MQFGVPELFNVDGSFSPNGDGSAEDAPLSKFPGLFGGFDQNSLSLVDSPLLSAAVSGLPVFDEAAYRALSSNIFDYTVETVDVFSCSREDTYAGYIQAEFDFGNAPDNFLKLSSICSLGQLKNRAATNMLLSYSQLTLLRKNACLSSK